ncbi:DUF6801 domain-containing protein [Nocardioides sp. InS609-2]|uniref:DUF6801 domain-containing protein n=1 Tax=Nocardioides sp. InS609-2 TaxID=2760705 RepID=UPI0020BFF273|nr:DUF6801 domain-containing protein [Nocardioides sp. InS609-2]
MLHTTSRRLAATVAATALGAGALVAMAAPAANAATLDTSYTCTFPIVGAQPVVVKIDAPLLPPTAPAGLDAPALPLSLTATLNKPVVDLLRNLGYTTVSATSTDMKATVVETGSTTSSADVLLENVVTVPAAIPAANTGDGSLKVVTPAAGGTAKSASTAAFNMPDAGSYAINAPASFSLTAIKQDGTQAGGIACALTAGAKNTIASLTLAKNESATTGKTAKKVTPVGKLAKLKVAVAADNEIPSGTVKVLKGKKVLGKGTLNSNGKVSVKLKKTLPVGVTKVTVSYLGDGYTEVSTSKKVKIKVG